MFLDQTLVTHGRPVLVLSGLSVKSVWFFLFFLFAKFEQNISPFSATLRGADGGPSDFVAAHSKEEAKFPGAY